MADRFGLDRLKRLCELEMLHAINIETAAHILYTADQHNAEVRVRTICMQCCAVLFCAFVTESAVIKCSSISVAVASPKSQVFTAMLRIQFGDSLFCNSASICIMRSYIAALQNLRERCLAFILQHFDEISRTSGFEEMGRINVDLGERPTHSFTAYVFIFYVLL